MDQAAIQQLLSGFFDNIVSMTVEHWLKLYEMLFASEMTKLDMALKMIEESPLPEPKFRWIHLKDPDFLERIGTVAKDAYLYGWMLHVMKYGLAPLEKPRRVFHLPSSFGE